mmetsp:Transcript_10684/g.33880  ORF Transcript_10684/g.33880 Transcript_10684/m.33880 type:complete len:252 (-) Transcript_10684:196-951(-)
MAVLTGITSASGETVNVNVSSSHVLPPPRPVLMTSVDGAWSSERRSVASTYSSGATLLPAEPQANSGSLFSSTIGSDSATWSVEPTPSPSGRTRPKRSVSPSGSCETVPSLASHGSMSMTSGITRLARYAGPILRAAPPSSPYRNPLRPSHTSNPEQMYCPIARVELHTRSLNMDSISVDLPMFSESSVARPPYAATKLATASASSSSVHRIARSPPLQTSPRASMSINRRPGCSSASSSSSSSSTTTSGN